MKSTKRLLFGYSRHGDKKEEPALADGGSQAPVLRFVGGSPKHLVADLLVDAKQTVAPNLDANAVLRANPHGRVGKRDGSLRDLFDRYAHRDSSSPNLVRRLGPVCRMGYQKATRIPTSGN